MDNRNGYKRYNNIQTCQDFDTSNEIKTSFIALHDRDNRKTLEYNEQNTPVETLNINAQQSHAG